MQKRKQKSFLRRITRITLSLAIAFNLFVLAGMVMVKAVQAEEAIPEETNFIDSGLVEVPKEDSGKILESLNSEEIIFDFSIPEFSSVELGVDIENAKIVSQEGSLLKISFDIINDNSQVQTYMRYGIFINEKDKKFSDSLPLYGKARQIYPEEINLGPNSKISRTVEYTVPSYLSGEYSLSVELYTQSGFYMGGQRISKPILLEGSNNILEIVSASCHIEINGRENERYHSVAGEASIIPQKERLIETCKVINHTDKQVTFVRGFKAYRESIFGNKTQNIQINPEEFIFTPHEEKLVTFPLPNDLDSQIYDIEVFLKTKEKTPSNSVMVRYFSQGASATIHNLIFDKTSYSKNEEAKVGLLTLLYPGQSQGEQDLSCDLLIKDKNSGQVCGQASEKLEIREDFEKVKNLIYEIDHAYEYEWDIPILKNCPDPILTITIKDGNGKILTQREMQEPIEDISKKFFKEKRTIAITILILLFATILATFVFLNIKRKK